MTTPLPALDISDLTSIRAASPGLVADRWTIRRHGPLLPPGRRLLIVAADHPARGALGVRDDPMAMGSRTELLRRLVAALERPGVDGVLAGPDILDDLLLLGALEHKVVIGAMNCGGLQGAAFEMDDRFTAYTPHEISVRGIEGGKMLLRVALDDPATAQTLEACSRAIGGLASRGRMALVEPSWATREGGRARALLDADSMIRAIGIASALGQSSAHTWLKLPVVPDLARVLDATTLPTLLLGGDPTEDPAGTYAEWERGLALPAVRGLVIGRALLYPPDGDVAGAVDAAAALVHTDVA